MGRYELIKGLYLKGLHSFESVKLEFDTGLVVLSGPSGAGKSLLMSSVLSSLGINNADANLCEIELYRPEGLNAEAYDLDDDIVIRTIKKERIRYFLNDQKISKKSLFHLFAPHINYLSVRDNGGFESEALLTLLDGSISAADDTYKKLLSTYQERYLSYKNKLSELKKIEESEKKLAELIEFTTFEINKIKTIDPKIGEDEELMVLKKQLSKIDKINEALSNAQEIFALESSVSDVYELIDKDSGYFSDAMNQLRADFEDTQQLSEELADTDVEELLDRLEKINELKNRHGSISEALAYKVSKESELEGYHRVEEDKSSLESLLKKEYKQLSSMATKIRKARVAQSITTAKSLGEYLSKLKLPTVSFEFEPIELCELGADRVDLALQNSKTATLSGGEYNRLRLALMVVSLDQNKSDNGIVILDEIDANVSGDESIAIADMIAKLSSSYQIFAISHQPHLAAKANQHILVDKKDNKSFTMVLDKQGRIQEISRIIGGELPNKEAIAFAQRLLK